MEFFRRSWAQSRAALEGMTRAEKSLIVALLALGVIGIAALVYWAGRPETVGIGSLASGRSDQVLARLQAAGIDARTEGSQIVVPIDERDKAIALLVQGQLLGEDWAAAFDEMVSSQTPWTTDEQGDRAYLVARQKVLSRIIGEFEGVRTARVVLDMPEIKGFGATTRHPSASVSVWMHNGRALKPAVPGIAGLVSGAVAGMELRDVQIIDGSTGRAHTAGDDENMLASDQLEHLKLVENDVRKKIEYALKYIDGVIVAVNVRIDSMTREVREASKYESPPVESERTVETTERNIADRGEPGPRSNVGADIAGGGPTGTERNHVETETDFGRPSVTQKSQQVHSGRATQKINATVNVPRGYFVNLYRRSNPDAEGDPDDAALEPIVAQQLGRIRAQIEPIIDAKEKGLIAVHMIPDMVMLDGVTRTDGLGGVIESGWIGPVGVTLLALFALALMLSMVRKATRPEALPSVEELSGVPATLPTEDDLIGEVEEHESSMEGVELDEHQLHGRRIAEQINNLIKANPAEAGAILGKWVRTED